MNKREFIKELEKKLNLEEEKVIIICDVLDDHFIVGKKNKEKMIKDFIEKLNISEEEANKIYNETTSIIKENLLDKLKHPFKSLD